MPLLILGRSDVCTTNHSRKKHLTPFLCLDASSLGKICASLAEKNPCVFLFQRDLRKFKTPFSSFHSFDLMDAFHVKRENVSFDGSVWRELLVLRPEMNCHASTRIQQMRFCFWTNPSFLFDVPTTRAPRRALSISSP